LIAPLWRLFEGKNGASTANVLPVFCLLTKDYLVGTENARVATKKIVAHGDTIMIGKLLYPDFILS